jgi:hypothetical protein
MSEETTKAQDKAKEMKWEEHLRLGFEGLRDEVRGRIKARENLQAAKKHGRAAMKETLMAFRSMIDGMLTQLDDAEADKPKRVTKIKIE